MSGALPALFYPVARLRRVYDPRSTGVEVEAQKDVVAYPRSQSRKEMGLGLTSSGCQASDSSRCSVICTPPPAAHLEDGMTRRTRSVIKTWGIEAESVMSTPFRGFTRQICTWKLP